MKYKLVIFDFDGTLADSFQFFLKTVNELADIYHFRKVDIEDIETLRRYDAKRVISYLGVPLWKAPIVGNSFKLKMAEKIDQVPLFPGVENMLRDLNRSGILLSLITSNSYDNVSRILNPNTMALMTYPQCGVSLFGKRPRLRHILRKTGIHPSEVIYIGDEIRDLEAARAENVDFGAVSWGYTRIDALIEHSPAEIFYSVEEISKKLAREHGMEEASKDGS